MEAAACYIGECRDPARDAKIALTAEGLYGVFVYIGTAVVFVGVLGASLKTADPLTLYTSFCDHIFGNAAWVKYLIGIPLIFALLLSVLNAIMGVARSLFQASEDRLLPRFFEHKNKHLVPDRAMAFNVVCALIVSLFGSPVRIYIFSNVGYIIAVAASLYGYFLLRQVRPERVSPFRLPGWFRWLALVVRALPHLRLLRGGLELARHRGWARTGALPLHPGPGDRGGVRPPVLVAQDQRQAAGDRRFRAHAAGPRFPRRHRPGRHPRAHGGHAGGRAEPVHDAGRDRAVTVTAPAPAPASGSPVRRKFGRRKFDKQPTQTAAVLIASNGEKIPGAAIRQALRISAGAARGRGDHRPHLRLLARPAQPGPDADKEGDGRAEGDRAAGACRPLRRAGRRPGVRSPPAGGRPRRSPRRQRPGASEHVLVIRPEKVGWRLFVEGDVAKEVAKKLGPGVTVEGVSP